MAINKFFLQIGSLCALVAVVLGAFGAHALKRQLSVERLATFETGVRYQMYHALALILVAILFALLPQKRLLNVAGYLFVAGIFLFSGSIYLLACRDLIGLTSWRWLGPLTPIGGTCFIIAWGVLSYIAFKPS